MESIADKVRNFLLLRIEAHNYKITDKASFDELVKMSMTECNVNKGSRQIVYLALKKIMKEKNIAIINQNPSKQIGDVKLNVPTPSQQTQPIQPPIQPLPSQPAQTILIQPTGETKKVLDPSIEKINQETFKGCFAFIGQIYSAFGFIKGTGKIDYKDMTAQEFETESNKLADRVGTFCYKRNIEIPMIIEALTIIGSAFIIFGIPLISTLMLKKEEVKLDKDLKPDTTKVHL